MFDSGNSSLRTDRWRYLRYADGSEELYDIVKDPNEWTNLSSSGGSEEVTATLSASLNQQLKRFVP